MAKRVLLAALALAGVYGADDRVRKSWGAYTSAEKDLYLSAVEKAMTTGNHLLFTQVYMDSTSLEQVVNTCGAPAWYRKWLIGYENMLRSLDSTYSDLTLPYWDVFEDAAKRVSTSTECSSIESCSPILQDFGGCEGEDQGAYVVNGVEVVGANCANSSIASYACSSSNSKSCEKCLPRGDWDIDSSSLEFGPTTFVDLISEANSAKSNSSSAVSAMDTLRKAVQNSVQLTLHSLLGGVYETRAAAFDPIFVNHYATLDMIYQFFQSCNQTVALTGTCAGNGKTKVSSTATIPMTINGTAVEKHAKLGAFFKGVGTTYKNLDSFAVQYEVSQFLQNMLKEYSMQCDSKKSATGALTYATTKSTFEDAAGINSLVAALADCEQTSTLTGSSVWGPSAFLSCELLASLQNGVFTNFSSPVRQFFGASQDDLPKCVSELAAVTTLEVSLKPSATCQKAVMKATSINTNSDLDTVTDGFAIVTRGLDGNVRYMNPVKSTS